MSKASEAIKAKRKQHRQDHNTDADRTINKANRGDLKGRRAARRANFEAQGNKSASDFNFDQHGKGHIGGQEIRHLQNQGHSKEDIMSAAKANGGEIGKRAQKRFDNWGAAKEKAEAVKENPVNTILPAPNPAPQQHIGPTPEQTPEPVGTIQPAGPPTPYNPPTQPTPPTNTSNEQKVDSSIDFNQNQDNDQKIVNNGDGNYNYQYADNSNRIYGGDNRVFNYQGSGNPENDSPMSAAVMAGFHAPDDSHAANAARLDRQVTMANDFAKDNMNTDWIAQGAIHKARNNTTIDVNKLDERIAGREANDFAQSKINEVKMFGDLEGQTMDWTQPKPAAPIEEPDFEKMYNTYTDY